jgi:hypothetical protein
MGNYHSISMKFDTQTKTEMLSSKITKAEMWVNFQDGRRHFGNSRDCYKMGNCQSILLKLWYTDWDRHAELKIHKSGNADHFQDGRRSLFWKFK